jgi:hypothetical protein
MIETTSDKPIALGPTPRLGQNFARWSGDPLAGHLSVVVPPLYWLTRFVTANTVHS